MTKTRWMTTLIAAGLFAGTSHADLLTYEGFDTETQSNFTNLTTGTGWAGAWSGQTGDASVRADRALSYTDGDSNVLPVAGFGAHINRTSRSVSRTFDATHSSGVFWLSVLYQPLLPGADGFVADENEHGMRLRNGTATASLNIGKSENNDNWRINGVDTGVSAVNTDLQFFLVRYEIGNTADDGSVHVWMNPVISAEPALGDAIVGQTGLDSTAMSFDNIIFSAPPGNLPSFDPQFAFDEIRLATDFANAVGVPEPASVAMLGIGGLAMLARRRR